jgi:hypothetical protein
VPYDNQFHVGEFVLGGIVFFAVAVWIFIIHAVVSDKITKFLDSRFPRKVFTSKEDNDNHIYEMGFYKGRQAKPGDECPTYHTLPCDKNH